MIRMSSFVRNSDESIVVNKIQSNIDMKSQISKICYDNKIKNYNQYMGEYQVIITPL